MLNIPPKIELRSSTKFVVEEAFLTFWPPSGLRLSWDSGSVAESCIGDQIEKKTNRVQGY